MVLLSGKRKAKDQIQNTLTNKLIVPYLKQDYTTLQQNIPYLHTLHLNSFYKKLIRVVEVSPMHSACNLSYQFKTHIELNPEHEIYHILFGKTKQYDLQKLETIINLLK